MSGSGVWRVTKWLRWPGMTGVGVAAPNPLPARGRGEGTNRGLARNRYLRLAGLGLGVHFSMGRAVVSQPSLATVTT